MIGLFDEGAWVWLFLLYGQHVLIVLSVLYMFCWIWGAYNNGKNRNNRL